MFFLLKNNRFRTIIATTFLLTIISMVLIAARPSDSMNKEINLAYLETAADAQFTKGNTTHFGNSPKSSDKLSGNIQFKPYSNSDNKDLNFIASGQGTIFVNGQAFPFQFNEEISTSVNANQNTFYHGVVQGTVKTKKGENMIAAFTILAIPTEDKMLITVGLDEILGEPVGLAFGQKFAEIDEWIKMKMQ